MVGPDKRGRSGPLRLAELLASVSLATDLGTGQPLGHALRTCTIATALAEAMGCGPDDVRTVHQFALLRFLGCTADAAETAALVGGDDRAYNAAMAPVFMGSAREIIGRHVRSVAPGQPGLRRLKLVAQGLADPKGAQRSLATHCEVAAMLARRAGLEHSVIEALGHAYERWDGKGYPAGLEGEAIPLAVRLVVVARDTDLALRLGDDPRAWTSERRGRAYDPAVVAAFDGVALDVLAQLDGADEWETALAHEPEPVTTIGPDTLDAVLTAFADFADVKSPWMRGHSRRVAALAEEAGRLAGLDDAACDGLRRAGLVHDLGRVAVENGIWDKPGPLTTSEWERVRLHPYFTERVLARCGSLASLVEPASAHHERVDGSGYHRSIPAEGLSRADRILAAADVFAALTADRPHRPAYADDDAARALEAECEGHLDADAVGCVLAAVGKRAAPSPARWPADLTDREVEVLRLIARGRSNREVGERLFISPKTVGRHVENLYAKIGVSSRAAAAVFAMEHRLLDRARWGVRPMPAPRDGRILRRMCEIRVNGVSLYYEEHGSGEPIVCIHGTSSSAAVWGDAVGVLAARGRTLVYDRRGCFRSERPEPYATTVHQHADDAAALIDALAGAPAIVIGRSYGGQVAIDLALRYPDRVRALALLEAALLSMSEIAARWAATVEEQVLAAAEVDISTVAETFLRLVAGDATWEGFPEPAKQMFTANGPAIVAELRGGFLDVTADQLGTITQPSLLVAGKDSPPAFAEVTRDMAAAMPSARVEWVDGGHLIDPAHPTVLAFVDDVLARPALLEPA